MICTIRFANDTIGGLPIAPFDVDVPDGPAGQVTVDLNRRIREHITATLRRVYAGPGSAQVVSVLSAREGSVHLGIVTLGYFSIQVVQ